MYQTVATRLIRSASAAIVALGLGSATAYAAAVPSSFRTIEYAASGEEAAVAEQALAERLAPSGASIDDAITALRASGAHRLSPATNGDLRFVYATSDFANDMQREIRVTIQLSQDGGRVGTVSVARQTYGD